MLPRVHKFIQIKRRRRRRRKHDVDLDAMVTHSPRVGPVRATQRDFREKELTFVSTLPSR